MEVMQFINGEREEFFLLFNSFLEHENPLASMITFLRLMPFWVLYVWAVIIKAAIAAIAFSLKKNLFSQAAGFILYNPIKVIGNGLLGYFAFLAVMIVFALSVFGIPVAVLLFFALWVISFMGEVSLGLAAGFLFCGSIKRKASASACMAMGVVAIEVLRKLPFLGYIISMLLLPIICAGVMFTLYYEGYVKKNFFELPFWGYEARGKSPCDMRETVMKGVN
ncbi:MAG: hypothetical protein LBU32_25820 [Clostridiales bacterium]|nr:hypothetical protein [Clostridiales bacterium]